MVKKLFRNLFLHSAKRTFFVVGGLITLIALPVTLFLSQQSQDIRQHASGCTYTFTSRGFLCVANEGSEGSTAPAVPANMSVTEGNINYYGTNGPIIELPNITNVPASNYVPPAPSITPAVEASAPTSVPNNASAQVSTCTDRDLRLGLTCTKTVDSVAQGCGCGPGLQCQHIGAQSNGLQTIQCVGYLPTGSECSPVGTLCGPYNGHGECVLYNGTYKCVVYPTATPTPTVKAQPTVVVPIEASTTTPVSNNTDTNGTTCPITGIKSIQYDKSGCFSVREVKALTVTCNDGTQKTFTSTFRCTETSQMDKNALSFCASHATCPTPTSTNSFTTTPTILTCDPVADGAINQLDYDLWLKEYTHQVNTTLTSCFVPGDSSVNILDFQVWKDITNNLIQDF